MNLPEISNAYTWQIENHLHTDKLARNEVRITLAEAQPHGLLHRHRVLLTKTIKLKDTNKRAMKIERAASKLLKKFQRQAYVENMNTYATYMARENIRHDRYNPTI